MSARASAVSATPVERAGPARRFADDSLGNRRTTDACGARLELDFPGRCRRTAGGVVTQASLTVSTNAGGRVVGRLAVSDRSSGMKVLGEGLNMVMPETPDIAGGESCLLCFRRIVQED